MCWSSSCPWCCKGNTFLFLVILLQITPKDYSTACLSPPAQAKVKLTNAVSCLSASPAGSSCGSRGPRGPEANTPHFYLCWEPTSVASGTWCRPPILHIYALLALLICLIRSLNTVNLNKFVSFRIFYFRSLWPETSQDAICTSKRKHLAFVMWGLINSLSQAVSQYPLHRVFLQGR